MLISSMAKTNNSFGLGLGCYLSTFGLTDKVFSSNRSIMKQNSRKLFLKAIKFLRNIR